MGVHSAMVQAQSGPIIMHLAEQVAEVDEVLDHLIARSTELPRTNHPVDARWCLIRCTQMSEAATIVLARTGAVARLCPFTESSLGDGIFNGTTYLGTRGAIGFGSDSNINISLFGELMTPRLFQRLRDGSRAALTTPERSTDRVLFDTAAKCGRQVGGRNIGQIAVGVLADLVELDDDNEWLCNRFGDAAFDSLIFGDDGKTCTSNV